MRNLFLSKKGLALGLLVLLVLGGVIWGIRHKSASQLPVAMVQKIPSLYEPGDKSKTILVREIDSATGKSSLVNANIRESKSRFNQMKQAVLAYLKGPRSGKARVPVPEGMELNELYLTEQGAAVVDLSASGVNPASFGFYEEALFIRGLIEVLGKNFFEVKQVKVLVDGKDLPSLGGHYALGTSEN